MFWLDCWFWRRLACFQAWFRERVLVCGLPRIWIRVDFRIRGCRLPAPSCRRRLVAMSQLENIVEDLKSLPPDKLQQAAAYIQGLKRISPEERRAILARTAGSLSREVADEIEKAIEEGCEKLDESHW